MCMCVCVESMSTLKKYWGIINLNDANVWYVSSLSPNTFDLPLYRNVYILQCIMFHTV